MRACVRVSTYGRTDVRTYVHTYIRFFVRTCVRTYEKWIEQKTKQVRQAHKKHQHEVHNPSKKSPKASKIESLGLQNRPPGASKRFLGTTMVSETPRGSTPIAFSFNFDQFRSPKLLQYSRKNEAKKHVEFPFHCERIFLYFRKLFGGILCSDGKAKMSFSSRRNASFLIFGLSETRPENIWRKSRIKAIFLLDLGVSFQRFFL